MRLAELIRLYAAVKNLEQKQLAEAWQCGESTVTRFLKDGQVPNGTTMARVIAWLMEDQ